MRTRTLCLAAALALSAVALAPPGAPSAAPEGARPVVTLGPGSSLWLDGTSNVHDYESRTTDVGITIVGDSTARIPADAAGFEALIRSAGVRGVDVEVPVRSLHSEKGAKLDKNLCKALQADRFPVIRFHLARYEIAPRGAAGDTSGIRAEGTLEVAGTSRAIRLEARAFREGIGVWLTGSAPLRMSEYGIRPPTMMLGALRVHDSITVHYRLFLVPPGEAGGTSLKPGH